MPTLSPDQASAAVGHERGHLLFNVGAIALAAALCGVAMAYGIDAARRAIGAPAPADPEATISRSLGGADLAIPLAWFRDADQRADGFAREIALRLYLPLGVDGALWPIELTLVPRGRVRPSAVLLDSVYLHRFGADQLSGPQGLVGKPLSGDDGFAGETVWYDPLSLDAFVAKCSAPAVQGGPVRCLRTVYVSAGVAAVYAFDEELLAAWRRFDSEAGAVLSEIGL